MCFRRALIGAVLYLFVMLLQNTAIAQNIHADNGNGTYTNPLISADFPDPDVIRVGDTYHMVSTTMFVFPGCTYLEISRPRKLGILQQCSASF
jgi:hypothetical protein